MPAAAPQHVRQHQASEDHGPFQIHTEHVDDVLLGQFIVGRREFHAGVVDEDVDAAELPAGLLEEAVPVGGITHVGGEGDGFGALPFPTSLRKVSRSAPG